MLGRPRVRWQSDRADAASHGGLLVALFRGALQGTGAHAYLSDASSAVLEVVVERR